MKGILGNRGAAAVEFAVLFLLLMIILFGIIEFGFIWMQSHYIANAAREGARVAAKGNYDNPADRDGQVKDAVKDYLKGLYSEDRVDGTGGFSPPSGGCCETGDFIEVVITDKNEDNSDLVISAGLDEDPAAVRVTVTVQTAQVWDPILWDLLRLLPGSSVSGNLSEITEFAVFAVEP
ncbi:MAG: TadE/TadG family type IV pilus assembly protein [Desulfurivibrionaceae bacterium]|nr:TadE/TadG family type IV pilus assembly protein [Desulfurivibrionaceae bacterium]